MRKDQFYPGFKLGLLLLVLNLVVSCDPAPPSLSPAEIVTVKDSVGQMAASIARDISKNGPAAWLNYFEDTPGFFMPSDGQLVFNDYPSAKKFILNTLVKSIPSIKLNWDHIRIDPLTSGFASIGADFHEDITNAGRQTLPVNGYFTGTAHHGHSGWKLRNLHWSIKAPTNPAAK